MGKIFAMDATQKKNAPSTSAQQSKRGGRKRTRPREAVNVALVTVLGVETVRMEVGRLSGQRWPNGSSGFRLMERVSHQAHAPMASTITEIRASLIMVHLLSGVWRRGRTWGGLEVASQALDLANTGISDAALRQLGQPVVVEACRGANVRPTALARL